MLFHTSIYLLIFLPLVVGIYFILNKIKKNLAIIFIVLAGLFFYGYWSIKYIPLIIITILFNFYIGKILLEDKENKKKILFFGIFINILSLIIFKYNNFFLQNLNFLFNFNLDDLSIELPLAISFFTFQNIIYLVDCYDKNIKDVTFSKFFLFIIFFPQLIAGPIVKFANIVPQFMRLENKKINLNNLFCGIIIIFIGLLKKILFADNLQLISDYGYENYLNLSTLESWLTTLSFSFQFYFDFSGYVDMAIGSALLFNIRLPKNFDSPFKAESIINFWQRWHITLSNFLTNYLFYYWYRSLKVKNFLNSMIIIFFVFLVAGLWHGPSWLFVIFGAFHGIGIICNHIFNKILNLRLSRIISIFLTFNFVNISFIFFRSESLNQSLILIQNMFFSFIFKNNIFISNQELFYLFLSFFIIFFFKNTGYLLESISNNQIPIKEKN